MSLSRFNLEHLDNHCGSFKSPCPMTGSGVARNASEETDQWLERTRVNYMVFVTCKAWRQLLLWPGTQGGLSLGSDCGMCDVCFPGVGVEGSPRRIVKRTKRKQTCSEQGVEPEGGQESAHMPSTYLLVL